MSTAPPEHVLRCFSDILVYTTCFVSDLQWSQVFGYCLRIDFGTKIPFYNQLEKFLGAKNSFWGKVLHNTFIVKILINNFGSITYLFCQKMCVIV